MAYLKVDNYIINKPIIDILYRLQLTLTNGKLKDIKKPSGGADNIVVTCPHHGDGRESTPACNIYIGEDGKPDVEKMGLITYEPIHHGYVELGKRVGNAFSDGKQLK